MNAVVGERDSFRLEPIALFQGEARIALRYQQRTVRADYSPPRHIRWAGREDLADQKAADGRIQRSTDLAVAGNVARRDLANDIKYLVPKGRHV